LSLVRASIQFLHPSTEPVEEVGIRGGTLLLKPRPDLLECAKLSRENRWLELWSEPSKGPFAIAGVGRHDPAILPPASVAEHR
jgi:hypothetical protein